MRKVAVPLLSALVGGLMALGTFTYFNPRPVKYTIYEGEGLSRHTTYFDEPIVPSPPPADFTGAAEKTIDAVVHITTVSKATTSRYNDPFYDFFFGGGGSYNIPPQTGSGSGVIVSAEGHIITNNHVVQGASTIEVALNDKRTFKAKVVGTDPNTDLAVIKVDAEDLPAITFGNSDNLKIGQWVLAIGNPFNLNSTVTAGIVSAKARSIDIIQENYKIESFIQTDAAVNPGNSGGALVNTDGELVGVNTAIQTHTGSFEGYSFAIPSNLVKKVLEDLIEYGKVQRGLLGVNIQEIDADFAKEKGIDQLKGVWVDGVVEGGAAATGGIEEGDVIIDVNDVAVNTVSQLQEQIGLYRPGDELTVTVLRDGTEKDINVTLKSADGSTKLVDKTTEVKELLGAKFAVPESSELTKLGLSNGLKVTEVNSGKLKSIGIKSGFIITEVNGQKISTLEDLESALGSSESSFYLGGMYPTGEKIYYSFNY